MSISSFYEMQTCLLLIADLLHDNFLLPHNNNSKMVLALEVGNPGDYVANIQLLNFSY